MILKYEDYKLNGVSVFERVAFSPPFKPSVTYEQEACFIYSISGNGMLYGGLEKDTVQSKESVLMKCGSFLNHWKSADRGQPCEIITIHITPDILNTIYENKIPDFLTKSTGRSDKIFKKIPRKTIVDEYIKGLVFYFDNPFLINEELIILKLKELILLLHNANYDDLSALLSALFSPLQLTFKSIVQAHLFEELEIKDFAALTNTSLSTFKRKFKQIFNDTPAQYITNKRLEKAAQLLKLTDHRITDICFDCGFNDLSTFSKSFSKKYQLPPSEYRNTN
ncbi:MAG: AraC family transcriptional regulator [Bacteroidota bacterium]